MKWFHIKLSDGRSFQQRADNAAHARKLAGRDGLEVVECYPAMEARRVITASMLPDVNRVR